MEIEKKYQYPISRQLIEDGRKNKVFSKKILKYIHVTMFHGKKDEVVPVSFSKKVLSIFKRAKKKLVIVRRTEAQFEYEPIFFHERQAS